MLLVKRQTPSAGPGPGSSPDPPPTASFSVSHCSVAKRASARVTLGPLEFNPAPFYQPPPSSSSSLFLPAPARAPSFPAPSLQRPHVLPSETNHRERTASAVPGRTGQGTQISEPYKSTRPPRLSVSPSLAKSSQVPSVPSPKSGSNPLVRVPVHFGGPSPTKYQPRLHLPAHPPKAPLPIHQSTNPPSHPPIINPGLIPRRPHPVIHQLPSLHSTVHFGATAPAFWAALQLHLCCTRAAVCSPHPRLDSPQPRITSESNLALRLPAVDLVFIWRQSDRFFLFFLPSCKTSTAFARIRAYRPTAHPTAPAPRSSTDKQQPSSCQPAGLCLSVCPSSSHPRLLLLPGVLLYCRALKPTKQASHRIALHRSAPPSFNTRRVCQDHSTLHPAILPAQWSSPPAASC